MAITSRHRCLVPSTGIVGLPIVAVGAMYLLLSAPMNTAVAGTIFLVATSCMSCAIGLALGYGRIGAMVGLLVGAAYLGQLFWQFPNGGHWRDVPGWPIEIPRF
jgi:hypothetical protein